MIKPSLFADQEREAKLNQLGDALQVMEQHVDFAALAAVLLSGWNARRTVFGCINLATGHRLFQIHRRQRAQAVQAFLHQAHRQTGLARDLAVGQRSQSHSHCLTDPGSGVRHPVVWLPKRAPELNPMDTLWGQGKDAICANKQYASIDEGAAHFIHYLAGLTDVKAMQTSRIQSQHFWLRQALSKNFFHLLRYRDSECRDKNFYHYLKQQQFDETVNYQVTFAAVLTAKSVRSESFSHPRYFLAVSVGLLDEADDLLINDRFLLPASGHKLCYCLLDKKNQDGNEESCCDECTDDDINRIHATFHVLVEVLFAAQPNE